MKDEKLTHIEYFIYVTLGERTEIFDPINIICLVCEKFNTSIDNITGESRQRDIVLLRRMMFLLFRKEQIKLTEIGKIFNRDHSTVIHGIKQINIDKENNFKELKKIERKLNQLGLYPF